MEEVILPIRVARFLGCHTAILTNAAGGINHDFHLGDLMLITGWCLSFAKACCVVWAVMTVDGRGCDGVMTWVCIQQAVVYREML